MFCAGRSHPVLNICIYVVIVLNFPTNIKLNIFTYVPLLHGLDKQWGALGQMEEDTHLRQEHTRPRQNGTEDGYMESAMSYDKFTHTT